MPLADQDNAKLIGQIESWRNRLLDIGNRNPLINTSFHPTRGPGVALSESLKPLLLTFNTLHFVVTE
jgi:hypothetical protein